MRNPLLRPAAAMAVVLSMALAWVCAPEPAAAAAKVGVTVDTQPAYTRANGTVDVIVRTRTRRTPGWQTVMLRISDADGKVVFTDRKTGAGEAASSRSRFTVKLAPLGLNPGRYRIDADVAAVGYTDGNGSAPLFVTDPKREPLPVAVVVRFAYVPARDTEDRFAIDPSLDTTPADQVRAAAELASLRPDFHLTLAPAPLMLQEWEDAADGYLLAGPNGVTEVGTSSAGARAAAGALDALGSAAGTSAVVMRLPYSDPDVAGLQQARAMADLGMQLGLASGVLGRVAGSFDASSTTLSDPSLPPTAISVLAERHVSRVLVSQRYGRLRRRVAAPGVYRAGDTTMTAIVTDQRVSGLLSKRETDRQALLDTLFARYMAPGRPQPVTAVVVVDGSASTVDALQAPLAVLAKTGWVRLTDVDGVAASRSRGVLTLPRVTPASKPAPEGYWTSVAEQRPPVIALWHAAGSEDADVARGLRQLAVGESALWAGPTGEWASADRARAFSVAAGTAAGETLGKVGITVPDVTLSGTKGTVPVSLANRSDKTLRLVLSITSPDLRRTRRPRRPVRLEPGETIASVKVDMGSELSGTLDLALIADELVLAEASSKVKASYLDRIVLILAVVVVLSALLVYIRRGIRRGRRSNAA